MKNTKTFAALVADALSHIQELMPWDVEAMQASHADLLIVDIREADEYDAAHMKNAMHVPRGILEASCDWGYSDTIPELAMARDKPVVLVCRSGNGPRTGGADVAVTGLPTGIFHENRGTWLE